MYFKFSLNFKKSERNGGFSLVELLVALSIIILLSTVVISRFSQFKLQVSLTKVAYKFAQDTRKAQGLALSSAQYRDASGALQSVKGYGVYADQLNNKKYIIYADKAPGTQNYDVADYIVETVDFSSIEPGIIIKEVDNVVGQTVSINFTPPNPSTTITQLVPGQSRVDVVFALASDQTKTKTVSINTAGLVEVK